MVNEIVLSLKDNVYLEIECDIDQAHELKQFFSCYIENYKFHPKVRARQWDGKITMFDIQTRTLPIGLMKDVRKFCDKYDYTLRLNFKREDIQNCITEDDLEPFYDALFNGLDISPRQHQKDAVFKALKNKRGVLEACTGFGKSLTIYSIIRFLLEDVDGKILLVVPSITLVRQMYSDFEEYGWGDISKYVSMLYGKSKTFDVKKRVLISTWQSLTKKSESFFDDYDAVLVDECHLSKSISIQTVLKKSKNATYRIGLTGTLPTSDVDRLNIFGFLGSPIYQLTSRTLIDAGYLSNIEIKNLYLRYTDQYIAEVKGKTYPEEVDFLVKCKKRYKTLSYILNHELVKSDENVLVLAQKIEHLDFIVEYLKEQHPDKEVFRIDGNVNADKREDIRQLIESKDGCILVATYGTLSTGVNIPKLHHVVFFSSYKSKIKVLQSVGRGLRKHKSKDMIIIWDVIDDLRWKKARRLNDDLPEYGINHTFNHFVERLKYYKQQKFDYDTIKINIKDL